MEAVNRVTITQGISFPRTLLAAAKRKAADERRNLSSYIQKLIDDDMRQPATEQPDMAVKPEAGK